MNTVKILVILMCIGLVGTQACSQSMDSNLFTKTPTPIKDTPLITPTTTLISNIATTTTQPNCISAIGQPAIPLINQGKIVLSGYLGVSGMSLDNPSYLLDVQSGEKIMLPQDENKIIIPTSYSVSSNREWLAYAQISLDAEPPNGTLHIVDAEGVEHNVIATNIDQRGTLWIDDTHLLIENLKESEATSEPKAGVLLISSITGEIKELSNAYPDQWNGDNLDWEFTLSRILYNPSLTKAIYPTFVEPNRIMRLIDIRTNKVLLDVPTTDYGKFPVWSPDGKRLAFATQTKKEAGWDAYRDEVFVLTEDGEFIQLTNFSKDDGYSYITGLSWSTDSNKVAVWINNTDWEKGYTGVHLAVLDMTTGNIHEYCDIQISDGQTYIPDMGNPIWSPDNQYILFNLIDPSDDKHLLVVSTEVSTGKTFLIDENYRGVGWLR